VCIKVEACGICHSDALVKEGHWPGLQYPRVPGHEIAGRVGATGADVTIMEARSACGRGMAPRTLLCVRRVPAGRLPAVPGRKN
jgi:D-arabinose 1-dehydrogenase-like Zn-dependent alcohol dehydrogenase